MKIVLIGSGNVATVLGRLFIKNGHTIQSVISQNIDHAKTLADEFLSEYNNFSKPINMDCDLVIISVSDYGIENIITEIIDSNPATKLEIIKTKEYTADYYTQDELLNLMEIIKTTSIELPVIIAGIYGLRREEVIGIKWNAIDFKTKTLTIRHTVGRGKIDGVTQFIFKDRL